MSVGTPIEGYAGRPLDALADLFYPLYRRLFGADSGFADDLERKLAQSRLPHNVEMYISLALAVGVISGAVLWIAGVALGYALFGGSSIGPLIGFPVPNEAVLNLIETARIPFLVLSTGIFFGFIGFTMAFVPIVGYPYLRAASRRREINVLMPDAVSYMYALSVGGMDQLEIMQAVADAEDTYGEFAKEFRTIMLETSHFDTDYRTAIRKQAFETPSDELNQFLTDMLSVIDSGGDMTRFLDDKKTLHFRTAKQEQQRILETLELFAEVFVTISLFPLLLIIVLIILNLLGQGRLTVLYAVVYLLIPLIGAAFTVIISATTQDEPGDGVLLPERESTLYGEETDGGLLDLGLADRFAGTYRMFDRIRKREGTYETLSLLRRPDLFFRDNPNYTMALTVPAVMVTLLAAIATGAAPTTWDGLVAAPVWGTFAYLYVPLLGVGIPLAFFYEWNLRSRYGIIDGLSENLRKLSSANDTGLTLLEAMKAVADTSSGRFAEELEVVYAKSKYGMSISESLVVLNNEYKIPQLARTIKLVSKAQQVSSQISSVLTTAAQAAENRDDIERERRSRTRMQVIIILMTYLTLLGVMGVLKVRFVDVIADLSAQTGGAGASFGTSINAPLLSLLFFHAVTFQAIVAGLVAGYVRDARLLSGAKYVVGLLLVALATWVVVG